MRVILDERGHFGLNRFCQKPLCPFAQYLGQHLSGMQP